MTAPLPRMESVSEALRDALPARGLRFPPNVDTYRHDMARWIVGGEPFAVALPRTTDEVQAVMRIAAASGTPVVPRGAGSGLSGGATAIDGCIVLSLELMDQVLEIDRENQTVLLEPGVINSDVSMAVRDLGLWYPPDPASLEFSTIGGNVATNAGGMCCMKYGVTRDYVLGLEVVLADGRVLNTGRNTIKGVAGYDLTSLFVGSEGTLGVITKIRLRLRTAPPSARTVAAFFPTLATAGDAVRRIAAAGVTPSMLEIMDRHTITAVDEWKRMDLDRSAGALLIAQSDAGDGQSEIEVDQIGLACTSAGASSVTVSTDPIEAEQLLLVRRLALPALERQGSILLDDIGVPRSRIPELLEEIEVIAARHDVVVGTFGHAGDGNMHPTIVYDAADPDETVAAQAAFDEIVRAAVLLDGTVTGEHGVGLLKRAYLEQEIGAVAVDTMRVIKTSLDPLGILNPGKALATPRPAPAVVATSPEARSADA